MLKDNYKSGYSLNQRYYKDEGIYNLEINNIFHKHWLFAGHISQVPDKGDYFLFEFSNESIIIVRNKNNKLKAHINVCRHRGSKICLDKKGNKNLLTCPYHAWSYDLDGVLISAREMPGDFKFEHNSLIPVHLELIGGFIFISLSKNPLSLNNLKRDLNETLELFGLDCLKLVKHKSYSIPANWKLAVENYNECYHCIPSHKEFSRIHLMGTNDEVFKLKKSEYQQLNENNPKYAQFNCYYDNAEPGQEGYQYDRNPLNPGIFSGTVTGEAAAPLLGKLTEYDHGASELMIGPLMFFLIYDDHIVGYRFTPISVDNCVCDIFWMVRDDAIENIDFNINNLIWLWDTTTLADKTIIINNQKGVNSKFYSPGRLSLMENFQKEFLDWYIKTIHGNTGHYIER
ncbi:aromatic ring-hydroxylating dioxygenase subunit alpha [Hellea sp.]|jgi:Rieske 2Fe-2S family protein|nr:aromatic ring-hydroxylating dioxygenase subunit alpha [Hellea sp.]MDB4844502.1 aromatic ring-hydroxylating dioxygenase subunit alpha [Hellea sp.]MDC0421502.1 aromatic ring-hydroxylating dioxygenase subunit alpha [Hellea sp.]MDC0650450.1 aromatic ring-hydroxylating dioxygenase subunit alpha [Hellea sp.]MDC1089504.1 aromatic ring-hydroxylating dioxygenase subunit alpha [Hellea sp.]